MTTYKQCMIYTVTVKDEATPVTIHEALALYNGKKVGYACSELSEKDAIKKVKKIIDNTL